MIIVSKRLLVDHSLVLDVVGLRFWISLVKAFLSQQGPDDTHGELTLRRYLTRCQKQRTTSFHIKTVYHFGIILGLDAVAKYTSEAVADEVTYDGTILEVRHVGALDRCSDNLLVPKFFVLEAHLELIGRLNGFLFLFWAHLALIFLKYPLLHSELVDLLLLLIQVGSERHRFRLAFLCTFFSDVELLLKLLRQLIC